MVELKDEEDGRVALIMGKEELPFAVEGAHAGGLSPPSRWRRMPRDAPVTNQVFAM